MPRRAPARKLLVEGKSDKFVIPYLIEANGIPWGDSPKEWIVHIDQFGGVTDLLKAGVIEAHLKSSGLKSMGIVLDADDDIAARWSRIRDRCIEQFHDLPETHPSNPIVVSNSDGLRLGIWIMPDNKSRGMLETFLLFLAPGTTSPLVQYARNACRTAKKKGASYKDVHQDKAEIYTWLAWQDEPGRTLQQAVKERILDPESPHAAGFVSWFQDLYQVDSKVT